MWALCILCLVNKERGRKREKKTSRVEAIFSFLFIVFVVFCHEHLKLKIQTVNNDSNKRRKSVRPFKRVIQLNGALHCLAKIRLLSIEKTEWIGKRHFLCAYRTETIASLSRSFVHGILKVILTMQPFYLYEISRF